MIKKYISSPPYRLVTALGIGIVSELSNCVYKLIKKLDSKVSRVRILSCAGYELVSRQAQGIRKNNWKHSSQQGISSNSACIKVSRIDGVASQLSKNDVDRSSSMFVTTTTKRFGKDNLAVISVLYDNSESILPSFQEPLFRQFSIPKFILPIFGN